ncbi:MAG TPA: S8 family serine peptidase, partial [Chloroflexota bacterium]|nr:S8 family serine peptidase [Chloroflexota bacterium]
MKHRAHPRVLRAGLIVALLAGAVLGPPRMAGAQAVAERGGPAANESPTAWLVELSGAPVAEGGSAAGALRERDDFLAAATRQGLRLRERFAYDGLFNGVSVEAGAGQVAGLRRLPGVRAVYPVFPVSLPPLTTSDPALATAPQLTGADVAQALGFSGEGVRVAVMDSGIDYHHPDLGGCFGSGCKVAFGHDFVGDAFNFDSDSPGYNPVPRPDRDPDDCPVLAGDTGGHGTHVAGIVGANGTVKGVAPGVTLGAYRVFGCSGPTSSVVILAAMDRVRADRVQVLNMSLGADFQWPQYPTAVAADRLVRRGVTVVAAFGNAGASGLYAGGAPAVGERVIAVAAFDNTRLVMPVFAVSPRNADVPFDLASGAPLPPKMGSLPLARTGTPAATSDACAPLPAGSLTGRAVLIRRGTCAFHLKALNAQNAGAGAVVLYNNDAGRLNASVTGSPPITIPVVTVSAAVGVAIDDRIADGVATLTWTDRTESLVVPSG